MGDPSDQGAGEPVTTPGTRIGPYVVLGELGRGAMAVVVHCRHEFLPTEHAVKVLVAPSWSVRERLLTEGRQQAAMSHPNLVRVTDVVPASGGPALVMELVRGPTLERLLAGGPLPLAEVDEIADGVLAGMAHAHARGLVHRDLKPANILLERDGGPWVAKVADFGLVKVLQGEGPAGTVPDAWLGTLPYMAPEQFRDPSRVDRRADVFSAGVVLYQLLCGRLPFPQPDYLEMVCAKEEGDFPSPRGLRPDLPPRMERAVLAALVSDPELRVADCEALREIWWGRALPGGAGPRRWPSVLARGLRARPLALAGLVGAAIGMVGIGAGVLEQRVAARWGEDGDRDTSERVAYQAAARRHEAGGLVWRVGGALTGAGVLVAGVGALGPAAPRRSGGRRRSPSGR